jgi:DNA-binding CsgD family transcriptional regulator
MTFDALSAVADLVCASDTEASECVRAVLAPVLPHQATILLIPGAELPVRIAGPSELQERLGAIDWLGLVAPKLPTADGASRLAVPDVIAGLHTTGWVAVSEGVAVVLIVAAQQRLKIDPVQERTVRLVAMLAAARERGIGQAPAPGTVAFSYAVSQERDRVRREFASQNAATLQRVLKALRGAAHESRSTPASLATAIDLASQALLEVTGSARRQDTALYVNWREAFAASEVELREIARSAGLRLISNAEGPERGMLPRSIARAARVVTSAAALNAARHPGAKKLRVRWRICDDALEITIADDGDGFRHDDEQAQSDQARLRRRMVGLGGTMQLDTAPGWGTTAVCRLPLRSPPIVLETRAAERIAKLSSREREVLELMVAGLRDREIAQQLYITVRTAKFHVSNILRKFEAESRAEVIVLAHAAVRDRAAER